MEKKAKLKSCTNEKDLLHRWKEETILDMPVIFPHWLHKTSDGKCLDPVMQWTRGAEKTQNKQSINADTSQVFQRTGNWAWYNLTERFKHIDSFTSYAYQIWKRQMIVNERKLQLEGIVGYSIWTRPDKVIIILGEDHRVPGREKCLQEGAAKFLPWFLANFKKHVRPDETWDIFLERQLPVIFEKNVPAFSPLLLIHNYALKENCFAHLKTEEKKTKTQKEPCSPFRFHYFDWRLHIHPLAFYFRNLSENLSPSEKLHHVRTSFSIFKNYVEKDFPASLLLLRNKFVQQIKKSGEAKDQEELIRLLQDMQKRNQALTTQLQLELGKFENMTNKMSETPSAFEYQEYKMEWKRVMQILVKQHYLSDYYAIARIMKPYIHRSVILCGYGHLQHLDKLLFRFGFHLEQSYFRPKDNFKACVPMPIISHW
jgi:hypothetical protein